MGTSRDDEAQEARSAGQNAARTAATGQGEATTRPLTIAIDGPAASGKSTIARIVARDLGLLYLDTGTMYRAVTWLALRHGLDLADERAVTALAASAAFAFPSLGGTEQVNPPIVVDGLDATAGLREPPVDAGVSIVAGYAGVRAALVREQQNVARARGVVMVGRDIGTVVLPDAGLKVYLVASAEERARRRYAERVALGQPADYEQIRQAMEQRDRLDAGRVHSPLRPAGDAVLLDTTGLSIDDVAARVLALARVVRA